MLGRYTGHTRPLLCTVSWLLPAGGAPGTGQAWSEQQGMWVWAGAAACVCLPQPTTAVGAGKSCITARRIRTWSWLFCRPTQARRVGLHPVQPDLLPRFCGAPFWPQALRDGAPHDVFRILTIHLGAQAPSERGAAPGEATASGAVVPEGWLALHPALVRRPACACLARLAHTLDLVLMCSVAAAFLSMLASLSCQNIWHLHQL
jgi:hypothetical protein